MTYRGYKLTYRTCNFSKFAGPYLQVPWEPAWTLRLAAVLSQLGAQGANAETALSAHLRCCTSKRCVERAPRCRERLRSQLALGQRLEQRAAPGCREMQERATNR